MSSGSPSQKRTKSPSSDISAMSHHSVSPQLHKTDNPEHPIHSNDSENPNNQDFQIKHSNDQKQIILYIQIDPNILKIAIKTPDKETLSESARLIKNCIFHRKIDIAGITAEFYVTYLGYRGLTFHLAVDNFGLMEQQKDEEELEARIKIIWDIPEKSDRNPGKYQNKWIQGDVQSHNFSFNLGPEYTHKILNNTLLMQIMIDHIERPCTKYNGLQNDGNLCYMNAFLQVLYHIVPIRKFIFENQFKRNGLMAYLQEIFLELQTSGISPGSEILLKHFRQFDSYPREQQDIHEFMISLFDDLEKQCPQLNQLWCGKDVEYIRSLDSLYQSKQDQDFNELQLHMTDSNGKALPTIEQALEALLTEQKMDDQLETDKHGKVTALKSRKFETLPPILFMNIKRYQYNVKRKQLRKMDLDLTYPYELNLNFLVGTPESQLKYILFGVVVHKGRSPNSGHYFTFLNLLGEEMTPSFYQFNDSIVSKASLDKVLNSFTGKPKAQILFSELSGKWKQRQFHSDSTAYMLVYIHKEKLKQFQELSYEVPQWYRNKLLQQQQKREKKNKLDCTIIAIKDQISYDPFIIDPEKQRVLDIQLKKDQPIEDVFEVIQPFMEEYLSEIGSIWKVNINKRIIKNISNLYGECSVTLSRLYENRVRTHIPDYFLVLGIEKNIEINLNEQIGILHYHQHSKTNPPASKLKLIQKKKIRQIIKAYQQSTQQVLYDEEELEFFEFGWTDYISIVIQ